ncbi:MAG: glycosyl transferase [Rhodobacteraceae bacterium]|nr:glycosyl transferase [Paracoccaceae bacterium]
MAKIAYILLSHKDPEGIVAQARRLTAAGDVVAIHFDGRSPQGDYQAIRSALADHPDVVFAARRVKCGWGEWSLVEATLLALQAAIEAFPRATHFYMLSGDCMPIKTAEYAHAVLDRDDVDWIESFDFHNSDWIKTGIKEERLIYRHFFNERRQKDWFYRALGWQRRLGLHRRPPADLAIQIGSQWWCLRRRTVEAALAFIARRRDVLRFFRTTWIPDETFFQTLVRHLVPESEIRTRPLTFLMFTDYGMPVTFYNDHYDLLLSQDYLFARKISPAATDLRRRLGALYAETGRSFPISDEGRSLLRFVTARGRVGRRFASPAWDSEAGLGPGRSLLMVACKKWHVAKRLADRVRSLADIPAVDYLFDEEVIDLPDLGGVQSTLEKRLRHRRAVLRLLFDTWRTDRLLFCVDPAALDLIRDLHAEKARVRLLQIDCDFTDAYLAGHARRMGLASERTPVATLDRLLPTLRHDIRFESDRLYEAGFPGFARIRQGASLAENSVALAGFLDIPLEQAREIAAPLHLFVD